ncbi:NAD(P)H-quinone oxidoreductase [Thalassovita sp.]|uniref:NAD(P)H-quinone oxidoreductase n=1 Tax=Thalassovita sp. TaxID=1979401 RepID=UPI0029DE6194|nr:NAD(P)H-quinone oxidoreductase [Thalassovita sp.]
MKAVVANGAGGPDVLQVVDRPIPEPGPREIRIKVAAAGVNRPDAVQRQGNYPPPPGASDVLGLELAGTVETMGRNVTRFRQGDRVMALVAGGGYAESAIVDETNALPVPEGMSMVEAAAFPETYFTVWSNVFERARLTAGETILIHGGTSGIGTTAIQLAKCFSARVITTVGSAEKAQAARGLGADRVINYKTEDFVAATLDMTDGGGADVVLDMVGADYLQKNFDAVAVDGRIAQIAFLSGSKGTFDLRPILVKRLALIGSTLRARPVSMKAELASALEHHVLPLLRERKAIPVIDSTFKLGDVRLAHTRLDTGAHIGKIVLTI